jgi:hypothetical protein
VSTLLVVLLSTIVVFAMALAVLGGGVGMPELVIWTALLVAALFAEVAYVRPRAASAGQR